MIRRRAKMLRRGGDKESEGETGSGKNNGD